MTRDTEPFAFKSSNGHDGICRIERLQLRDGRTLVICHELEENPGNAVTNVIEQLIPQVARKFGLDLRRVVWIEHTEEAEGNAHEWDVVNFKVDRRGSILDPEWHPMTADDWHELGLEPR
ncbi:MAG TPA: hypothetical protein VGR35_11820 [Tepidisphaeraceae bacterium]|nr:hypothetical protein [Tepidisphaeraceae bacterium]